MNSLEMHTKLYKLSKSKNIIKKIHMYKEENEISYPIAYFYIEAFKIYDVQNLIKVLKFYLDHGVKFYYYDIICCYHYRVNVPDDIRIEFNTILVKSGLSYRENEYTLWQKFVSCMIHSVSSWNEYCTSMDNMEKYIYELVDLGIYPENEDPDHYYAPTEIVDKMVDIAIKENLGIEHAKRISDFVEKRLKRK